MFNRLLLLLISLSSAAFAGEARTSHEAIADAATRFINTQLAGYGDQASFQLGHIDSRVELAACGKIDVQVPQGSRLLGNTSLRIGCTKGAKWVVSLPVTVSVQTSYWVAARALAAGYEITENDVERRTGDLAQLPPTVITDHTMAIGHTLLGGTPAGAPLRSDQMRAAYAVKINDAVKVVATGNGFEVASEGRAMGNANDGQQVSIKMATGAIVQGIARVGGTVEIKY